MAISKEAVLERLARIAAPGGKGDIVAAGMIDGVHTTADTVIFSIRVPAELARKLVCITFDVQTNRKVFGETFSRITGGDPITTRRLYEEVQGNVTPTVRFVGSMNPDTPEYIASPDALERRLIFLPCGAKITDPDPDRFAKLKAERPGILVRWQHALQRLYQRGHFDIPDAAKAEVEEYIHNQEAFDLFAAERLVADANAATPVAEITRDFNYWVDQAGATHLSPQVVGRKLRRLGFQCVSQRVERDGRSINTRVVRARIRTNRKLSEEF